MAHPTRWVTLLAAAAAVACGGDAPPGEGEARAATPVPGEVRVLIATADARIGEIADLVVDAEGTVYAVDRQAAEIHVVDASGRVTSFGRPGAGPGEYARPSALEVLGDTLLVVDWGNGRLQGVTRTGEPLFTRGLPPGQAPAIGAGGWMVRPTWGNDTVLAVIHAPDLASVAGIGRIAGTPTGTVYPRSMKEEIRQGKVPAIFLNMAEAVLGPDSTTWLYVQARGTVQRFDAAGRELFAVAVQEPEADGLLQAFMDANAALPVGSFAPLSYVAAATLVGEDLWLLLGHSRSGPTSVRVLRGDGSWGPRLEFPGVTGASRLAVDLPRGVVYFVRGDAAELVRVPLPDPLP
ncbi:MAG: hypothetical protein AMXMBFR53_37480 [Gemmatimonadota bacterium]